MPLHSTAGRIYVNEVLPKELRDYDAVWDKKHIAKVMQALAEKHPDKFASVLRDLHRVGYISSDAAGGMTFSLEHLRKAKAANLLGQEISAKVDRMIADPNLSDDDKDAKIVELLGSSLKPMEDAVMKESLDERNPFALQALSGTRGSPTNVKSIRGGDLMYVDHQDRPIPVPILHSYSEGLSPAEYFAGTFGARKGVLDTKLMVGATGYFCLGPGTQVQMADWTTKAIEDIQPGDWVIGVNKERKTLPVRVTTVFQHGLKQVNRYTFRLNRSHTQVVQVDATEDHRILGQIRNGKRDSVPPQLMPMSRSMVEAFSACAAAEYIGDDGKHEPLAFLYGMLIGDGGLTGSSAMLSLAKDVEPTLYDYLCGLLQQHDFELRPTSTPYQYCVYDLKPNRENHTGPRSRLIGRLRELGLWGCRSWEKRMPAEVDLWDNASVAALLAGIIASDGSVGVPAETTVPGIRLSLTSEHLVEGFRRLFRLRFGCHFSGVRRTKAKDIQPNTVFLQALQRTVTVQSRHDVFHTLLQDGASIERILRLVPIPGRKGDFLRAAGEKMRSQRNGSFSYPGLSMEPLGLLPTYDIEVDHPDHMFLLANGLISSNSKKLIQSAHRLLVEANDHPSWDGSMRGLPVDTADPDNEGALLAYDVGGYKRNTILTPRILSELKAAGHDQILVRSPMTFGTPNGGVYASDVGVREKGGLPPVGDYVGFAAAQALGEKSTQSALSSKHAGGIAGAGKAVGGFALMSQMTEVPKNFKGGAAHAQLDGTVGAVEPAPQGGHYVTVGNKKHYVAQGFDVRVKPGDEVEAGDVLSDGIPNPAEIVMHKGVGDGRKYFAEAFRQAYKDAGTTIHRRNSELVARGLIDHIRFTDPYEEHLPDDVYPYSRIEHHWRPRDGHTVLSPQRAAGQYLEKPILHYSIGTKVRPSVVKTLGKFGVQNVMVHKDPPPFQPEMIRGMENLSHDPDWMTRMLGSYLQKNLLRGAQRGAVSDETGTSYVPSLARGENFGLSGPTAGWKAEKPKKKTTLDLGSI